jgi:uncharacterized protein YcbX
VTVWNSRVPAHDAGDAAAGWLSSFLGVDVRLVRFDPAHQRRCNPDYAGDSGAHTAFADGYRTHAALGGVAFGMNAIVVAGEGRDLSVGAGVEAHFAF